MTLANARNCRGVTLIELMVALAVFAIVISVGAPSLQALIVSSRLTGQANDVLAALNLARGEAVRRNQRAVFCAVPVASGVPNTAACIDPGTGAWPGWMVFGDANADGVLSGGEIVFRAGTLGGGATAMVSSPALVAAGNLVVFRPDGLARANGTQTLQQVALRICDSASVAGMNVRDIALVFGSRMGVVRASDPSCAAPGNP